MNAARNVTATFAPNQYPLTITVVGDGTAEKTPTQTLYDYGSTVTLTATPGVGSQFVSWSGDFSSSSNPATVTIDGAKAVTCTFASNLQTLTTNVVGSGSITRTPNQASYAHGTVVTLQAVPGIGYHFVSWSGALSGSTNPTTVTMDADQSVTATFAINTYTLSVTAVGSGTISKSPNQADYDHGTSVTLTANPSTGYHLAAWSGDLTGSLNPASITMDANKSVTGTFAINTYTLTVSTVGSGTVTKSPNQGTYDHGTSATLTAVPATGYHFVAWSGDLTGSTNPAAITMDANKSVTATFAINQYALNVTVSGSGSVSKNPNQATYSHGISVTLSATPVTGNHFVNWSGDLTGSANPAAITMDGIKNVTATFAPDLLVLTVNVVGQGTVTRSPNQSTYAPGAQVSLQATPLPGYTFSGWSGDLAGSQNPATITMDASHVVTASFVSVTNPVVAENQLPGNPPSQWDVIGQGDPTTLGFASDMSVNTGQPVQFKVNTNASAFHFDIYRLGYYGGQGARLVATVPGVPGTQPEPLRDLTTGLVDCGNWSVSGTWNVPSNAVSGVYLAKVIRDDTQGASHILFIVRKDAGASDLLLQTSDATWQAYNGYGGNSLYGGNAPFPSGHAAKVSYNRPLTNRGTSNSEHFFTSEYPMVRWLEANGYDVSYFSSVDSDLRGGLIANHRVFLSVGHDEYWSGNQRAFVTAARDAGTNLMFLSGNEVYWKVRYEPSIDGSNTPNRTLVCYKEGTLGERGCGTKCDPAPGVWTGLWRDGCGSAYPANDGCRPENDLTGSLSWVGSSAVINVPYEYKQMRMWRNTDVTTLFPGASEPLGEWTLGFEWDPEQISDGYPASRVALSSTSVGGQTHHVSVYRAGSALVFSAGTIQWSWGLDEYRDGWLGDVSNAQRQGTANVLAEMNAFPGSPSAGLVVPTPSGDHTPPVTAITSPPNGATLPGGHLVTVSGTAVDAAGAIGKVQVSIDGGLAWHDAVGTSPWTYNWTPGATGPVQILARSADDWGNLETTGPGISINVTDPLNYNCPCTVWAPSSTPGAADGGDLAPAEVGFKFRAVASGQVRGIRFFKSAANTGTHIGNLWNSAGTLLEQATFAGETASGWQEALFSSPMSIVAGDTYVASVFMPTGHFAIDAGAFETEGVTSGPLSALANGEDGPNGVIAHAASSTFPTTGLGASNYWVDVNFTDFSAPDLTAPTITAVTPLTGSTGVSNSGSVTATFSEALDPASVSSATFQLSDPFGSPVPAAISWQAGAHLAVLDPSVPLSFSTTYTALIHGGLSGARILDASGNPLAANSSWSFTTAGPPIAPLDDGPGGPVLVVATQSNPFTRYYAEILRAEGFNEFTLKELSLVTPAVLGGYDVVLVGETALTDDQATMFSNWAIGGGTLIAMRPDARLLGLLGLGPSAGTLSNQYIKVGGTNAAGAGITQETMQFHGSADLHPLAGATSIATLYSDRATATSYPAVSQAPVGSAGGVAIAFNYDLARSVVYTRQGNPAWAGQDRDGLSPATPSDMFYGASSTDPQSDWVDLQRVTIPQADEQQRLLANLILLGNLHRKPLPRLWYLPDGKKAAVVLTGKNFGGPGIAEQFDLYRQVSAPGCSIDDWECVLATAYEPVGSVVTPAQAAFYQNAGFDVAPHVDTRCANDTPAELGSAYGDQLSQFSSTYPNLPPAATARTICSPWSDWSSQAEIEAAHDLRLDTSYQFKPLAWVADRPGLFTGSAWPMRFTEQDGSLINCYQLAVQMTEESGQTYPKTPDSLFTRALDVRGYYGAFAANLIFDGQSSPASAAIVTSAQAFGLPIVSASQMLTWLDARRATAFGNLTWDGSHLGFFMVAPATAAHMQTMLPLRVGGAQLTVLTQGGAPLAFSVDIIKGIAYAFFKSTPGDYVATYQSDTAPPGITDLAVAVGATGTSAVISWQTNELADSRVDYGTGSTTLSSSSSALSFSHGITLTGLTPGVTYSYRVTSLDASGHPSSSPPYTQAPATFSTPPSPCVVDETEEDFGAGQNQATYVSGTEDGEVILAPALGTEFNQLPPSAEWLVTPLLAQASATVADGELLLSGARLSAEPEAGFGPGHSLEFEVTFSASRPQDIGFGAGGDTGPNDVLNAAPWAMLSAGLGEPSLTARTWTGGAFIDQPLSNDLLGTPHQYKIHWTTGSIEYSVDGVLLNTQSVAIPGPMRPAIRDAGNGGTPMPVKWIRMTPYASSGTFLSRVFDPGSGQQWTAVRWSASVPASTSLAIDVRAGGTPTPDGSWTTFHTIPFSGSPANVTGRYMQYRVRLATTDAEKTPELEDLGVACTAASTTTGVPEAGLPAVTLARPPMPNPASRETAFEYAIGTDLAGHGPVAVSLVVYDLQGRTVRAVVHTPQSAGRYRASWNVTDDDGRRMRAGVYYYRLAIGPFSRSGKVVILN